jgi:lipopolysaccharide biosynthesis regulator YciM
MNHYPMYPSSHSVRARSCISVLVRDMACACVQVQVSVANSLFNLALVYEKKEEWEKAVDCYQQVYDIESKIFGQDHTQVKETLEALNEAKQNLE